MPKKNDALAQRLAQLARVYRTPETFIAVVKSAQSYGHLTPTTAKRRNKRKMQKASRAANPGRTS